MVTGIAIATNVVIIADAMRSNGERQSVFFKVFPLSFHCISRRVGRQRDLPGTEAFPLIYA